MALAPIPANVDLLAREIVDAAINVHRALGPGLLESVYEHCLVHDLNKRELNPRRQVALPITYDGTKLDGQLRIDLLVGGLIIVEISLLKCSCPSINPNCSPT
jgi:GxxExxY protein